MNRILPVFLFLLFSFTDSIASHIVGGEVIYTYIGPGTSANTSKYRVTLRLFTECNQACGNGSSVACPPTSPIVGIFDNVQPYNRVQNVTLSLSVNPLIDLTTYPPCLDIRPTVCYKVNTYTADVQLNNTAAGYRLAYQTCCRVSTLNVLSDAGTLSGVPGATYETILPGTNILPVGNNSNAVVNLKDTSLVCFSSPFRLDFGAIDPDGDSLSYQFSSAFNGGSFTSAQDANGPDNPLYGPVNYSGVYSGLSPLGNAANIDPVSGLISGTAPSSPGKYVVNVIVREWRNGVNIAEHQKDFIMEVKNCVIPEAKINPDNRTCDGFTRDFFNSGSNAGVDTWFWDFGVPNLRNDTSNLPNPTFTYPDTGVFVLTLIINRGTGCVDTATTIIKVYPGFFPGFNVDPPYCKGVPVQFVDQTRTNYGNVTGWRWNFGVNGVTSDTSNLKTPAFTYSNPGSYTIKLIVSNTFGCTDSTTREVIIKDNPALSVFPKDTTYCSLDSVMLKATGTGIFSWSPATNIINANTATPTVFPAVATNYTAKLNADGCTSSETVRVNPVNDLTTSISPSAVVICAEDTITLTASSNYTNNLSWSWTPVGSVSDPAAKVTKAFPSVNTTYRLTTRWGRSCTATATKDITVKALAVPEAGPGTYICKGQTTAQLQASGGVSYQWIPATGLNNPDISNPIASPAVTTIYKVFVGVAGCTKTKADSVVVLVRDLPEANLVDDTLICSIDTLRLITNPANSYVWTPDYMINNLTAASPLVSPDVPTTYYTTLTDAFGCVNKDSIVVDVKLFVTIDAGNDTTICRTDTFHLRTVSDALSYQWSPATYLNNTADKNPVVTPLDSFITYRVIGNIGKCQSRDSVTIRTVPYPVVTINPDQRICFGDSAILHATGGGNYSWSPVSFLNSVTSSDPIAVKPTGDVQYTVAVTENRGCPKPVFASTWVRVRQPVLATTGITDTTIVIGQAIQMNAGGGDRYIWSPGRWLSDVGAPKTIATPEDDITYKVTVVQLPENCVGTDSVKIKVYLLPPSFYVPTAFSPNGDGRNDVLKPIALGMRSIRYFKVYNRLGNLVFETTELGKGWDGFYKGFPQDPATYVWMAQGETYKGEFITRKGTAVLIR
ncbi:MAG: gliding motility-associated C-terminal domain-containing protein [Chitinophagaceae bacterium]|nr:gliding motility-associated C-terminal domain-containing protein [Chitinophagaceae bacterium]